MAPTIKVAGPTWKKNLSLKDKYGGFGFADGMGRHGYACAFKGNAHERLVSRRWLKYGPWHVLRDEENDVSVVQFHELDVDPETAFHQAWPGHEKMGISDSGGFLQTDFVYELDWKGFYLNEERVLEVVVTGREVSQLEMLEACALRHYQQLGPEKPLDNVRFIFPLEEEAQANLHELWLRELECWAIIEGKKVRLDTDYHPEPDKPKWVKDLEEREGS